MVESAEPGVIWPEAFPQPWASAWGVDEIGAWMAFDVLGDPETETVLRWVPPGTFLMGSPADEPERRDDETRHRVTLTAGYWLAETACPQILWTTLMGTNPSHFDADPQCPVEQVSFEEVTDFLRRLDDRVEGLDPRLPTEAEWEYACRAGTSTPFWQGGQLDSTLANFHGNYPMPGGAKSDYRERTMPVRSFAPNPLGLYQMHGNVFEWVSDWYGRLSEDSVHDPVGPDQGTRRVLRGGSWILDARRCRSAYRSLDTPDYRILYVGFRLARGQ